MDTFFDEKQCKCVLTDIPIWAAFYGYANFIKTKLNISTKIHNINIIIVQCPYTFPPIYNKSLPDMRYVFYNMLFDSGKMPDSRDQVPVF